MFGLFRSKQKTTKVEQRILMRSAPETLALVKSLKAIMVLLERFGGMAGSRLINCCGDLIIALLNGDIDIAQARKMFDGIKGMLAGVIAIRPRSLTMADAVAWRAAVMQLMADTDAYGAWWVINDQDDLGQRIRAQVAAAQAEMHRAHWLTLPLALSAEMKRQIKIEETLAMYARKEARSVKPVTPPPEPEPADPAEAHKPTFGWSPR